MRKHKIENICWREAVWQRPVRLEEVWEALCHLAALTPRGTVVWEARSRDGRVRYLLGADKKHISSIEEAFKAHGDIRFHDVTGETRLDSGVARQLKVTHPSLSLKTDITESAIRAGLAALSGGDGKAEAVVQVVLGGAYAPSPVPAELPDPGATWLEIILGNVRKATAEGRKSVREKAEQHGFQAVVRIGISGDNNSSRLHDITSAFKMLESAGVRIRGETVRPGKINLTHAPWHYPLKLSVKELAAFLLLPVGEDELPGTPGLHPKMTLPPAWYRPPANLQNDRCFALSMEAVSPKKLSISIRDTALTGYGKYSTL